MPVRKKTEKPEPVYCANCAHVYNTWMNPRYWMCAGHGQIDFKTGGVAVRFCDFINTDGACKFHMPRPQPQHKTFAEWVRGVIGVTHD